MIRRPPRSTLDRSSAASDVYKRQVLAESVGRRERLLDRRDEGRPREVVTERAAIDVPLAAAGPEVHAADRFLATADRVRDLRIGHRLLRLALRQGQDLRLLTGVRMLGARVHAELATQH